MGFIKRLFALALVFAACGQLNPNQIQLSGAANSTPIWYGKVNGGNAPTNNSFAMSAASTTNDYISHHSFQTVAAVPDPLFNQNAYIAGNTCATVASCGAGYTYQPLAAILNITTGGVTNAVQVSAGNFLNVATNANAAHDVPSVGTAYYAKPNGSVGWQVLEVYGGITPFYSSVAAAACSLNQGVSDHCQAFCIIANDSGTITPSSPQCAFLPDLGHSEVSIVNAGYINNFNAYVTLIEGQGQTGDYHFNTRAGEGWVNIYVATSATDGYVVTDNGNYDPYTTSINTATVGEGMIPVDEPRSSNSWTEIGIATGTAGTGSISFAFPTGMPGAGQTCSTGSFTTSATTATTATNAVAALNAASSCTSPSGATANSYHYLVPTGHTQCASCVLGSTIGIELNNYNTLATVSPSGPRVNCIIPTVASWTVVNLTLTSTFQCSASIGTHYNFNIPGIRHSTLYPNRLYFYGYSTNKSGAWLTSVGVTGPSACYYIKEANTQSITTSGTITLTDLAGNNSKTATLSHTGLPPSMLGYGNVTTSTYEFPAAKNVSTDQPGTCDSSEEGDPVVTQAPNYAVNQLGGLTEDYSGNIWVAYTGNDSTGVYYNKANKINPSTLAVTVPGNNYVDPGHGFTAVNGTNANITTGRGTGIIYYGTVYASGTNAGCSTAGPTFVLYTFIPGVSSAWSAAQCIGGSTVANTSQAAFGSVTVSDIPNGPSLMIGVWQAPGSTNNGTLYTVIYPCP